MNKCTIAYDLRCALTYIESATNRAVKEGNNAAIVDTHSLRTQLQHTLGRLGGAVEAADLGPDDPRKRL